MVDAEKVVKIEEPLISVIMPLFNVESYIDKAIQSILDQSYAHIEVLICDDGSTDNTYAICNNYATKDKRIKLFKNKTNLGNLKTTNFLLSECRGKYISIQDGDDYSLKNRFETLLNYFSQDEQLGMIGSNYLAVTYDEQPIFSGNLPRLDHEIKMEMQKEVIPVLYASILVRKEIVDEIGYFRTFFDRKGYADFDWMARIAEKTKVLNCKDILYVYRRHHLSFTKTSNVKHSHFFHKLIVEMHKRRILGQEDYFKTNNLKGIRKLISTFYLMRAMQNYWDKNKEVYSDLYKSIFTNPLNVGAWKTLFYISRKKILPIF